MKYIIGATALALSTTAFAQTATPPAATPPAATATPPAATATPASPATAPVETVTEPATTTAQAVPAPAPQAAPDPKAVLAQQFPTYDKDGNGMLSQIEFSGWLTEMKTAQNTEKLTPEQITKWATDSFTKADKDKSKSVTVAELQGFLVPSA